MSWNFSSPLRSLSDEATIQRSEALWEKENLGGLTEDNNMIPAPVVWLVALTVITAFAITFPLWGQRPTAGLYTAYVHDMDSADVQAAASDEEAMKLIVSKHANGPDQALLERHPLTMDDLRIIRPQILALETKGVDLKDYNVVGDQVVLANFEGNYRADGTRIRQQPWWDKGYTIDIFYVMAFFTGVFLVVKRLPPTSWQPRHNGH
jgi:hypothetical protein